MRRLLAPAAVAVLLAVAPAGAAAAPSLVKVGDFTQPVHVAGPPGDASRVFVVEQGGLVKLVVNGQETATPFLDLTDETLVSEERGLLSIAFAPDYATSGRFYVFLTAAGIEWPAGVDDGDILILRGLRSAQNPNVADKGSLEIVEEIDHPASFHNGGQLAFGPDGKLYASIGDNGSGAEAQSGGSFYGKVIRFPDPTAAPEIWARGLRNPWRFSFDRVTGDAWIGDVGELTQEEIDHVAFTSAGGHNFGWPDCEGTLNDCGGFTAPVMTFEHSAGHAAIIGGFVVRDPGLPSLVGRYLFGDLAKQAAFSAAVASPQARTEPGVSTAGGLRSFGEDGCGRIYVATASQVRRVTETASNACVPPAGEPDPPGGGQQPPPGGGTPDTTKPAVTVKRGKRRVRAFVLKLRSDEAARATVTARGYKSRTVQLAAGVTRKVTVKARRKTIRKLRGKRRVVRKVRIRVVDAAGNSTVRTPKIRLR
ncbi:MAG: PQQ-dependent sugar dehydrogenase [Solirubrobacteraceae bacterium]